MNLKVQESISLAKELVLKEKKINPDWKDLTTKIPDQNCVENSLDLHLDTFQDGPKTYAIDRGMWWDENIFHCIIGGIKKIVDYKNKKVEYLAPHEILSRPFKFNKKIDKECFLICLRPRSRRKQKTGGPRCNKNFYTTPIHSIEIL